MALAQAAPPVDPGPPLRADLTRGETPGGAAAPINLLTSISDGTQTGAIPAGWRCGVCHRPHGCSPFQLWLNTEDPLEDDEILPNEDLKTVYDAACDVESWAFDIPHGVRLECGSEEQAVAMATAELEALTPTAMAAYLHAYLVAHATEVGSGDPPLVTAVGGLFAARAAAGFGGGVLHLPDVAVAAALDAGLIVRGGTRYTSLYGGPSTVGPGTPATGPDETVAGTAWVFVSGPVDYALDPVEVLSTSTSFDQARQNRVSSALVERRALVRVNDCNVFATRVLLPATPAAEES